MNETDAPIDLSAGELFGFNVGIFSEKTVQAAQLLVSSAIPWLLRTDYQTVIHVSDAGKSPRCVAQMACFAAQTMGVTALSVMDHNLSPLVDKEALVSF